MKLKCKQTDKLFGLNEKSLTSLSYKDISHIKKRGKSHGNTHKG